MGNRKYSGVGVGSTSIIMILVVLCLTTFSILSYSSSRVGEKFAKKSKTFTALYYLADKNANTTLSKIDGVLFESSGDNIGYGDGVLSLDKIAGVSVLEKTNCYIVNFNSTISDSRMISVELEIPLNPSNERYKITKWLATSVGIEYEDDIPDLWDGK